MQSQLRPGDLSYNFQCSRSDCVDETAFVLLSAFTANENRVLMPRQSRFCECADEPQRDVP